MKRVEIRKDSYVDSVFLMLLSKELEERDDVVAATVAMGTPMNLDLLKGGGYDAEALSGAGPSDLVMAVEAADEAAMAAAFAAASDLLAGKKKKASASAAEAPRSIEGAIELLDGANMAVISLPGAYAAREARAALKAGLHVMLFSDNVSLEDEISLKSQASAAGLLMMGPDCGTAIVDGVPLCFANVVKRGGVGIVAASGTGLQEVSCLVDRFGAGVSQAIGTGGRDLKNEKVGGATMLAGIGALGADPGTKVIVVVSKPPAPAVAAKVVAALDATGKPAVVHFIGLAASGLAAGGASVRWALNLEETARMAAKLAGAPPEVPERGTGPAAWPFDMDADEIGELVRLETDGMAPAQKYIRGYYTGGTLADEAWLLLHRLTGAIHSNNQTDPAFVLADPKKSVGHTVVDLGDDVFTVGRPHPMIDPSVRTERIDAERDDPSIAVMLVDVVLGYGSHADPAGALVPALRAAKVAAVARGGYLPVIASVTGTPSDYQGYEDQVAKLRNAGVIVMPSNYQAAKLALRILEELGVSDSGDGRSAAPSQPGASGSVIPSPRAAGIPGSGPGKILELFGTGVAAVNLGLESFAENIRACGAEAAQVDWRPPAGGDPAIIAVLDRLDRGSTVDVDAANAAAVERLLAGKPMVVGIGRAADVVPGMRKDLILHAGPPVTWDRMCGPMRGAVIGGLIYEGLASGREDAEKLAASGRIAFEPCHHHAAVGPMAGIMTASMPVWILENAAFGNRAYATLNEGLGKVLRYGAFSAEVIDRLKWMADELAPILEAAIKRHGPLDMRSLITQALQMGDECHNRNRAGTSLVIRELAPHLVMLGAKAEVLNRVFSFLNGNDHFFLNLSMPASKCVMDATAGIEGSSMISAMARNGTEFGIRISGLGDRWFTGPASVVEGLYLPGYTAADAGRDIGDSVITETAGIGGFAMAAAPAIVKFVGGSPEDAIAFTKRMYEITLAESREYRIPALDFRGTPTGIDVRKVVEKGILPVINTGIAHKDPGIGMVGAGLVKPPENCFRDALAAFAERYGA